MSTDFYQPVKYGSITKVKDVPRVRAIRLYCEQAGGSWGLQIRAPLNLQNRKEGKDFIVAHATLHREDLEALRDAINEHLGPAE
jgi:hypothetical protein